MKPENYYRSLMGHAFGASGRATIYYPGSAGDDGPIDLFLSATDESVDFYYVDYVREGVNLDSVREKIENDPRRGSLIVETELSPGDFGASSLKAFYPSRGRCTEDEWARLSRRMPANQENLGFRISNGRATFTYLEAEAIQCFKVLLKNKIFPNVVVLEDPGFGGEWTCFGGDSKLFRAAKIQPRYLYVAEGTAPWPNYVQVTNHRIDENSAHRRRRSIYSNRWFG